MFKELNTMKIFFEKTSKEFNVREVARLLKISPATASKDLKNFTKMGLLKERKERVLNMYKANLESDLYRDLKTYYNIRNLKESGLIESLNTFYFKPTIIIFGSCASGIDTEASDFDILIISEKTKEFPGIEKFEKKIKKKLHLLIVKHIKDLKNEHLINNVLNGISIQGRIKWI